jgi:hypothetical protein
MYSIKFYDWQLGTFVSVPEACFSGTKQGTQDIARDVAILLGGVAPHRFSLRPTWQLVIAR